MKGGIILTSSNKILNGGFENNTFPPWENSNATFTTQFSHSGRQAAKLIGDTKNSFIYQLVNTTPTEQFVFSGFLGKIGKLPSPPLSISLAYYDKDLNFLEYGLITNFPKGHLTNTADEEWLKVNETTSIAPLGTTQALLLINKLPQTGTADVIVDDVELLDVSTYLENNKEVVSSAVTKSLTVGATEETNQMETYSNTLAMNRIYVANSGDTEVSVIDGITNSVIATIPVSSSDLNPGNVGVNPITNRIYVANASNHNVSVIDGTTNTIIATVTVGTEPIGIGVDLVTNRSFVANFTSANVSVIDGDSYTVIATIPLTRPRYVSLNSITNQVYVSNDYPYNNINVINGTTNAVIATIPVGNDPVGIDINPISNQIYVVNESDNNVSVIDGATNTVVATIAVGTQPEGIGVNPITGRIYVANTSNRNISVIDGNTNYVIATVTVGIGPVGVGVNPLTHKIYVSNLGNDNVSVISGTTNTVIATVLVGPGPTAISVNP